MTENLDSDPSGSISHPDPSTRQREEPLQGQGVSCIRDNSVLNTLPLVQCTAGCAGSRSNYTAKGAVCLRVFKIPLYSTPPTPTQCKAGYSGTSSNCTSCEAGTYKNFIERDFFAVKDSSRPHYPFPGTSSNPQGERPHRRLHPSTTTSCVVCLTLAWVCLIRVWV